MSKRVLYLEEFTEDLKLDNKQKIKLIELLLLISSILVAFKLPSDLIGLFMIFVLFSVVYWIILQKDKIRPINSVSTMVKNIFPLMISFFFVLIVTSIQFSDIMKLSDTVTTIPGVLFIVWFITFFSVIWIALAPDLNILDKKR